MNENTAYKRDLLTNAAIAYVKSLISFNVSQRENKVFIEVKIEEDILLTLDLNSIRDFESIQLGDSTAFIEQDRVDIREHVE